MSLSEQLAADLESLLQNSSLTELCEALDICLNRGSLTGTELDAVKFAMLLKLAKGFASTANNQYNKEGFMQIVSSARVHATVHLLLNTTASTSSPSN